MQVLLVDDEKEFLHQTKIFLEREIDDLSLDISIHVEDALEGMEEKDYDAIISDYQMPDIDGLEFLKIVREDKKSDIPFIIFTGRGREDVAMKALNLGANRYLQKGGDPRSQYGVLADAVLKEINSHKKEKRLRESERTHREIFDKAGIPIFIHDIDTGRVINANEEAADLYGYSKEEIKEKGVGEFSAGGEEYNQKKVKEQIETTVKKGPQRFLWKGEKKDGSKTWEEVKLTPAEIKGETRVLATINDITELKKIEREKEKNLQELQFINDTILKVSRMDDIDEICKYLGEQVHSVNEDSYVFISLYDEEKDGITLRSAVGLEEYKELISDALDNVEEMRLNPDKIKSDKDLYTSGELEEIPGGLYTFLAGKLDKDSCKSIEEMLNIKKSYTVGFALDNMPYGGIIILKRKDTNVKYKKAIETIASHLSLLLQHKQVEEKRKKIEKRYNALYERSLDGIYIFDLEGNLLDANPRALRILGCSENEIGSLDYKDIFVEESIEKINKTIQEVIETGAQEDPVELKLKRKDGKEIWVETKTHLLYKNGEPYAFQGIAREITERKKIERKMKKKERAIQTSINGIGMADLDGNIHYVNDSLIDMWGYENREELLNKNITNLIKNKEKVQKAIQTIIKKGGWKGELKGVKKDGTVFDIFASANPIYDEDGDVDDLLGSVIDISDIKVTEKKIEKLHDITRRLERCEEEDKVFDIAIEAAEKILDFEMCTLDIVEGEKLVVKATSSNIPTNGTEDRPLSDGIAGKTYQEGESYLINDINKNSAAEPVKSDYRSALSVPIGNFGVFQAVSTEKKHFDGQDVNMAELLMDHVRDTLKRIKSTKKQEFLHSLLRHDVKNKTQIVEGYLHLLSDEDLSDKQANYLDKAYKATKEGQEIIKKVKTLRDIEEEGIKEVDVISPLREAVNSNKKVVKDVDISINCEKNCCKVKGGALLEELFFNIINNAINHTECDEIDISLIDKGEECLVTIEDDGKGIPDDEKIKILKKGYKKGDKAGSGLGLYLVKTIINNYGGSLEVRDSKKGGARFDIYLKKV